MANARFLHTADLHLGRPFGYLPPQLGEERRSDQRKTLTKIGDLALERNVDLVLIAGDLFDSPDPDPIDLEAVIKEFTRLTSSSKRIFVIPGNHDYTSPNSFWRNLAMDGLHVFNNTEWETVNIDDLGIAISGIAFDRTKSERRAFQDLSLPHDKPSIVLLHASYEAFEGQLDRYHPFSAAELADVSASYIALGHYHKFNPIITGVRRSSACYPGTPEGISFDGSETGSRFVVVGEIGDEIGTSIDPVKINQRTMKNIEIDCTSFESEGGLIDAVRAACEPNALIQLKLCGMISADISSSVNTLADRFKDSCHYISLDTSRLSMLAEMPESDLTIRGRFCRHMLEQIAETTDPERAKTLRKALDLGLSALSGKEGAWS
ncbi:MAG: metallophosphoesterase family protein [Armatimonadota bacterium]